MVVVDLKDATQNQIQMWVSQNNLADKLVEVFDKGKVKAHFFFIVGPAAEKARRTELKALDFSPLEILAINHNIEENKGSRSVNSFM